MVLWSTKSAGKIFFILALILISSFVLHGVIEHEHPEEIYGSGMQAIFHGENRKWWTLLLFASFFISFSRILKDKQVSTRLTSFRGSAFWLAFDFSRILDPIREALRRGLLHPKLCG